MHLEVSQALVGLNPEKQIRVAPTLSTILLRSLNVEPSDSDKRPKGSDCLASGFVLQMLFRLTGAQGAPYILYYSGIQSIHYLFS